MDINNLSARDALKIVLVVLLLGGIGAGVALNSTSKTSNTSQQSQGAGKTNNQPSNFATENNSAQITKCVSAARQAGYGSGNCAHDFIEACLAGSREKMQSVYAYDRSIGTIKDNYAMRSCGYPDTYTAAFDKF